MTRTWLNILVLILLLAACGQEEKTAPSSLELQPAEFSELDGWSQDDLTGAFEAYKLSCQALSGRRQEYLGNAKIKIKTAVYQDLCRRAAQLQPQDFRHFLEANFRPYLVLYNHSATGKFTAYYEPIIEVSRHKDAQYQYPIHAKPLDLIEFNPHDFDPGLPSKRLLGRVQGQKLVPYYARADITSGKAQAPVLLWAKSFVDVFIMHIQGPALAVLPDGEQIRISYADTNGREFKGIGSILLSRGELKPGEASMGNIKKWLNRNPQKAKAYMNENPRYVFHRLIGASGPLGALGTPLVAGRSLAVDKNYIPLGALLWLETTAPQNRPLHKLVSAQDVGGAITGAIRGDYYWGSGGDDVLELAGQMNASGQYYILLPQSGED